MAKPSIEWHGPEVLAIVSKAAFRAVVRGAESVKDRMVERVMEPPKSGKIYTRRSIKHQASAPGESPASDTGRLVQSMTVIYDAPKVMATINVATDYAASLEFGTMHMAARPYGRVSLIEKQEEIQADVIREIGAVLK